MDSHIHIYTHFCYAASYYTGHRFLRESHILHTHFHAKISTCVDAKTYSLLIIIGIIGLRVSIKNFVTPLSRDLSFCHFQIT